MHRQIAYLEKLNKADDLGGEPAPHGKHGAGKRQHARIIEWLKAWRPFGRRLPVSRLKLDVDAFVDHATNILHH